MRRFLVCLVVFCVLCISVLGALPDFQYYKTIDAKGHVGPLIVDIDEDVFSHMQAAGNDLRVMAYGDEIPYRLIITPVAEVAHKGSVVSTSSERQPFRGFVFDGSKLIDGDYSANDGATYQNNPVYDHSSSYLVLDFGQTILTDSIRLWTPKSDYSWNYISIDGSDDMQSWHNIKPKTKYGYSQVRTVSYPPSQYRYLKITLGFPQSLLISEIEVYGASSAQLIFNAESGKAYYLYYGNPQSPAPEYDTSQIFHALETPHVTLSSQAVNPDYETDADADGIELSDNCPFLANPDQADSDYDGIGDVCDNCPHIGNRNQKDSDKDSVGDASDNCPFIANPDQLDRDLNGIGYVCDDSDHDSIMNKDDNCEYTSNPGQADLDNDGIGDICQDDTDGDGIADASDNCRYISNADLADVDKDGIGDACDNCPEKKNSLQVDQDNNGIGDDCDADYADDDSDGFMNSKDNCPFLANPDLADGDNDGIGDACDNCPTLKNADQLDENKNGLGDICDDTDGDGIHNFKDNCPKLSNPVQTDRNNNGIGDDCEDFDNDSILNQADNCLLERNNDQQDSDHDGLGDACDDKDDRFTENKRLVWAVIIIVIAVVSFLAIRLFRKAA